MVYLIHFNRKVADHAQHYLGFVESPENLPARLTLHRSGNGSALMAEVKRLGIPWQLVRIWPTADRTEERRMKNWKNSPRLCPLCNRKQSLY